MCPWIPQEVAQCLRRGRGLGPKRGALLDPLQGDLGRWGLKATSLFFFPDEETTIVYECVHVYDYDFLELYN